MRIGKTMRWMQGAIPILIMMFAGTVMAAQQPGFLDHGLFLTEHRGEVGKYDPVIGGIIDGRKIDARKGQTVNFTNGKSAVWTEQKADSDNWFRGKYLDGAYGYFVVNSNGERTAILRSYGDEMVYVNGVPREGNKYAYKDKYPKWEAGYNYSEIPIRLRSGKNELLFLCNRGRLKASLTYVRPGVYFNTADSTLPYFLTGKKINDYGAVVLLNATDRPLDGAFIKAAGDNGISSVSRVPMIQPMSLRKVGFKLEGPARDSAGMTAVHLTLISGSGSTARTLANGKVMIKTVPPSVTHDVTFISKIDGSVQYYAVVPPRGPANGKPKALFFSLHGADVIATNQANSYYPKTWGYIVCPTNGRPYGWDWESWGRLDALQVLHIVKSKLNLDPSRIYLTGHSMGGHGTLINGVTYPDQWGAIGASAGWISWWSYVFLHDTASSPMAKMLQRATTPLHTLKMKNNYKQLGVYILQGSKDDNVPITESIHLSDTLSKFDKDFVFHEEMGVGHWWGLGDEAGTDCVDWPPMFDYFARHARQGESRILNIDFTTANPGISAKDYWVTIYNQERQLEPSRVIVRFIPSRNKFIGTTQNVKTLAFDLKMADPAKPFVVDLDGTKLDSVVVPSDAGKLWLVKDAGAWHVSEAPPVNEKGPARYGTFKDAFRHDVVFVYGTHGTREENRWAFNRARYDAEYFWYQGNGSIDIVSDRDFNPDAYANRNVILYGNEKTNSAWNEVLGNSPVTMSQGRLVFGKKVMRGGDYSLMMVRPKKGNPARSVGVVGGTGIKGMRLTYTVPYLQPGFALPDVTVLDGKLAPKGLYGAKVAGFFGLDWSVNQGDFAWR